MTYFDFKKTTSESAHLFINQKTGKNLIIQTRHDDDLPQDYRIWYKCCNDENIYTFVASDITAISDYKKAFEFVGRYDKKIIIKTQKWNKK